MICDLRSQEMEDNFQLVYAFLYRYTLCNLSRQQHHKVAHLCIVGTKQIPCSFLVHKKDSHYIVSVYFQVLLLMTQFHKCSLNHFSQISVYSLKLCLTTLAERLVLPKIIDAL